ncbi:MAG: hypothetical protein M1838_002603 [Thelocarpon superellum]|nr:MAG: hypothetical protein M1838_002603 [Thelocarpon superellum]
MTAVSARSPSVAPPRDRASPRSRPPKHSTTPLAVARRPPTPASVGQDMPPRASPPSQYPRHSSYFDFAADSTTEPSSNDPRYATNKWSPPTSSIRSAAVPSPKHLDHDPSSDYSAFKRESETNVFTLGNLSRPLRSPGEDAAAGRKSPRFAPVKDAAVSPHDDRMEVDSAYHSAPSSHRPSASDASSILDIPRYDSPAMMGSAESPKARRSRRPSLDHRHPHLSLPAGRAAPPSPSPVPSPSHPTHQVRAETLPATIDKDGCSMISPQDLLDLRASFHDTILLLDLRVFPQFSQARLPGALNLCIPTTLLKRPSFTVQKLAETFTRDGEKRRFAQWRSSRYIVMYDDRSMQKKDAVSCLNTVKKFAKEGWNGRAYILRGGFVDFSKKYPNHVDREAVGGPSDASTTALSIAPPSSDVAHVAGGCPMPATKSAANPFFGNIRQNMDLIGGVGQIPIKRPSALAHSAATRLPLWMRQAADEADEGKTVSDRFLAIEQAEQHRMQDALSGHVSYGSPTTDGPPKVRIAGIEKGSKNRYNNIWPYDHARVKLEGGPRGSCDYVNASHITTKWSNKRYIATQGPLPTTFDDFWRVVWEQDVRVIVMLTAESEGGQVKCHQYWKGKSYGPLKLQPLSERKISLDSHRLRHHSGKRRSNEHGPLSPSGSADQPYLMLRKFTLAHSLHPFVPMREISQLQYSSWPDFGAPAHPSQVLGLVEQCDAVVRSYQSPSLTSTSESGGPSPCPSTQRPVLVHCSAGCGRTGTFCTVDTVIDMLKAQRRPELSRALSASPMNIDSGSPPQPSAERTPTTSGDETDRAGRDGTDLIARTVEEFRDQRLSMVQSLRQFVLCYETVLEWLVMQGQG